MANGPEPQDRNKGTAPSFSNSQLEAFKRNLGPTEAAPIVIPGFLFRDERPRSFEPEYRHGHFEGYFYPYGQRTEGFNKLGPIDDNLLLEHVKTYISGLEARERLLARIKPVEILSMVRDIWGRGEITEKTLGATLTYKYLRVVEETYYHVNTVEHYHIMTGRSYSTVESSGKTGKWKAKPDSVSEDIQVDFGNKAYQSLPLPGGLYRGAFSDRDAKYHGELDEFFADSYNGVRERFIGDEYFREIPRVIWRRPDNLVITVNYPRTFFAYDGQPELENQYRSIFDCYVWFDQSASQQEIMDFLAQKLEAERALGLLPPQLEALELAKIEELKRRGLFEE